MPNKNKKSSRRSGKATRRRRAARNGRNLGSTMRYELSGKPQTLGRGTTTVVVNIDRIIGANPAFVDMTELTAKSEFRQAVIQYRYVKMTRLCVTVFAHSSVATANSEPTYIRMLWTSDESETTIIDDDSTKVVPALNTRNKTFTFIPPNASLPLASTNCQLKQMNYREWAIADDLLDTDLDVYAFPGSLHVDSTSVNWIIRIEAFVVFRGKKVAAASSLMHLSQVVKREEEDKIAKLQERRKRAQLNKEIEERAIKMILSYQILSADSERVTNPIEKPNTVSETGEQ